MNIQGDLFEWIEAREKQPQTGAVILDARPRLQARTIAFYSALVRGYHPPYRDTQIVQLQEKRASRAA